MKKPCKNKCYWCEKVFDKGEVDHIIPRKAGGDDKEVNKLEICFECNRHKSFRLWLKSKNKIVKLRKEKEHNRFIDFEESSNNLKIIITTVYTLKKPRVRLNKDEYKRFGENIDESGEKVTKVLERIGEKLTNDWGVYDRWNY